MKRREFLELSAAAGAGALLSSGKSACSAADDPAPASDSSAAETINVGLIGVGLQGRALLNACLNIPGVRFLAICDIWPYAQKYGQRYLDRYGQPVRAYVDHREMVDQEKDLDAVLVATPDFAHAAQTVTCLRAGLHVYCEAMMSDTLDGARSMVQAMHETGRLLQIGYQRRSNPRYRHALQRLLTEARLAGTITHVNTQWAHEVMEDTGWPSRFALEDSVLQQYGYDSMHEFRNWRWFRKYCLGPCGVFGTHQLDVCNWFLGTTPDAVLASGDGRFYESRDCLDNVMAVFEYGVGERVVRVFSQILTTTNVGGQRNFEHFLGTEASIKIAENPKWTAVYREPIAPDWDQWIRRGYLAKPTPQEAQPQVDGVPLVRETRELETFEIPVVLDKPRQQPHLENFFAAVRGTEPLNCPADLALQTEVVAHKMLKAAATGEKMTLAPDDALQPS
jgi:predicted dehydrogenase